MNRRRRGGWRRKGKKLQIYVRVHEGKGGMHTRTVDLGTAPREMQEWIDTTWKRHRTRPRGQKGTLAADIPIYLALLADRPRLQQNRAHQLAWWCEQFGDRSRWSLTAVELETALRQLPASVKAASTIQKYRMALYHLFTKLDGRNEPNPLRDVPPPKSEDPLPRAIPYTIIAAIFDEMPDERYATKLDAATAAAIYREATAPRANRSAIAQAHGLSETMVRKIVAKAGRRFDSKSQTKARLQVMAYAGLPPAQMRALRPDDVDLEGASVLVRGRKKGGGVRAQRLPLVPEAVTAMRAFVAADCFERERPTGGLTAFSMTSAGRSWRRAITTMCVKLEADPITRPTVAALRTALAGARPYDLRHSFLTEAQLATGNINATQGLAMHSDARMTRRYTLAAVTPELQAAAAAVQARWAARLSAAVATPTAALPDPPRRRGQRTGNGTPDAISRNRQNAPKTVRRKTRPAKAQLRRKLVKVRGR